MRILVKTLPVVVVALIIVAVSVVLVVPRPQPLHTVYISNRTRHTLRNVTVRYAHEIVMTIGTLVEGGCSEFHQLALPVPDRATVTWSEKGVPYVVDVELGTFARVDPGHMYLWFVIDTDGSVKAGGVDTSELVPPVDDRHFF